MATSRRIREEGRGKGGGGGVKREIHGERKWMFSLLCMAAIWTLAVAIGGSQRYSN